MPDETPDLSAWEDQFLDVEDPAGFRKIELPNAAEVFRLIAEVTPLLAEDIVHVLNEGGTQSMCQYVLLSDGTTIIAAVTDPQTMQIVVKHPAGKVWIGKREA